MMSLLSNFLKSSIYLFLLRDYHQTKFGLIWIKGSKLMEGRGRIPSPAHQVENVLNRPGNIELEAVQLRIFGFLFLVIQKSKTDMSCYTSKYFDHSWSFSLLWTTVRYRSIPSYNTKSFAQETAIWPGQLMPNANLIRWFTIFAYF